MAGHDAAREVGDLVSEGVPCAAMLLQDGVRGWWDGVPFDDERVEVYHFQMVVEEVDGDLTAYV